MEYTHHGCFECNKWKFHKRWSKKYHRIINENMGYCTIFHKYMHKYEECIFSLVLNQLKYDLKKMENKK